MDGSTTSWVIATCGFFRFFLSFCGWSAISGSTFVVATSVIGAGGSAGGVICPLLTKKRHSPGSVCTLMSSFFVRLHQDGKSTPTVESRETISKSSPGLNGSMCLRIKRSSPLPQSKSPPSKLSFGGYGCTVVSVIAAPFEPVRLVGDARGPVGQELDEFGTANNGGTLDQVLWFDTAFLHTRGTDVNLATGFNEVCDQFCKRSEALFVNVIGIALFGQAHTLGGEEHHGVLI